MGRHGSKIIKRPEFRQEVVDLYYKFRTRRKEYDESVFPIGRCIDEGIRWNA